MVIVRIEIRDGKYTELSQIVTIKNDCTGDGKIGHYDVRAVDGGTQETYLTARVERFQRDKKTVLQLVRCALNALGTKERE